MRQLYILVICTHFNRRMLMAPQLEYMHTQVYNIHHNWSMMHTCTWLTTVHSFELYLISNLLPTRFNKN